MTDDVRELYLQFHAATGDPFSASNLTLAHVVRTQQRNPPEAALTVAEVAERLRICTKTVYRMVKAGEIPHCRLGHQIRIAPSALQEFLEESARGREHRRSDHRSYPYLLPK